MSENQQPAYSCPICDTPVSVGSTVCPNVNCKEDLSSFIFLDTSADTSYQMALNLIRESDTKTDEAMDLLHNAASLEPENVDVWVVLGKLYAQHKDYISAERCWNRALAIQPNESRSRAGLNRLQKIKHRNMLVTWAVYGFSVLLFVWLGIRVFTLPSPDVAKAFANNPALAVYNVRVDQKQNFVELAGILPGETEKELIIASARMVLPGAVIDSSHLVLAPAKPTEIATLLPTPTVVLPTVLPTGSPTLLPYPTALACEVTTGLMRGTLYLRAAGDIHSSVLGVVNEGDTLLITGGMNKQGWIPVQNTSGLTGWVNGRFCK